MPNKPYQHHSIETSRKRILAVLKPDEMMTIPEIARASKIDPGTVEHILCDDGKNDNEFYCLRKRDVEGNILDYRFSSNVKDAPMFIDVHAMSLGMHDPIERVVRIDPNTNFVQLHFILQSAFGFKNQHAFNFYYKNPDDGTDAEILQFADEELEERVLRYVADSDDESLIYAYDFTDSWTFLLRVVNVGSQLPGMIIPDLISARNPDIPENCDGIFFYENLILAANDGRKERLREVQNHFEYLLSHFSKDVNFKSAQRRVRSSLGWLARTMAKKNKRPVVLGSTYPLQTRPELPPLSLAQTYGKSA